MATVRSQRISTLLNEYLKIRRNAPALLDIIDESEVAERVYNSNAIENSTLTLPETEKILQQIETSRRITLREVFEAKNLAQVYQYIKKTAPGRPLDTNMILSLHTMLFTNIRDEIAGRFRMGSEMVQVGGHIAPPPEFVPMRVEEAIVQLDSTGLSGDTLHSVARFHGEFEDIHPFVDGNGRIGRVLIDYLFIRRGLPPIIVRNKEKNAYYNALRSYDAAHDAKPLQRVLELATIESLHRRIAYLHTLRITPIAEYAKRDKRSIHSLLNSARKQTIPAFREKGVWKMGETQDTSHETRNM